MDAVNPGAIPESNAGGAHHRRVLPLATALRQSFAQGYRWTDLRADLLAGAVVGVVALPLAMALAVASGVPPQHGLYTAIVAGGVIALLGGSRVQVSGPTAAFVVILAPIAAKLGLGGLLVASMLAGLMLILMGLARFGRLIEFIPFPVTSGFTAGIAIVIASLQVKDFLGLQINDMPERFTEKVRAIVLHLPTVHWPDAAIGALTLLLLIVLPRVARRLPAPLLALPIAAVVAALLPQIATDATVETIRSRFPATGGVPASPPTFQWPWLQPLGSVAEGASLVDVLDGPLFESLVLAGFAIAMLGAIESLLTAVISDGMTGHRHNPDAELIAQGVGNVVAPFFGGFAATGAIARTATNIRNGARSPIAAFVHAVFILVSMLVAAPLLGYLPMASMAAQLLIVAWNMSDAQHVAHILRVAPRGDVLVLLACLTLTVVFDMVIAVGVGVVLAAVLFMNRMAQVSTVRLLAEREEVSELGEELPPGVVLYRVDGPLFFGAAQKAMSALEAIHQSVRVVLLDLSAVPHMDATALVALESTLSKLHKRRVFVVVAGVQDQPLHLMAKAGWKHRDWLIVWRSLEDGVALARTLSASDVDALQPAVST